MNYLKKILFISFFGIMIKNTKTKINTDNAINCFYIFATAYLEDFILKSTLQKPEKNPITVDYSVFNNNLKKIEKTLTDFAVKDLIFSGLHENIFNFDKNILINIKNNEKIYSKQLIFTLKFIELYGKLKKLSLKKLKQISKTALLLSAGFGFGKYKTEKTLKKYLNENLFDIKKEENNNLKTVGSSLTCGLIRNFIIDPIFNLLIISTIIKLNSNKNVNDKNNEIDTALNTIETTKGLTDMYCSFDDLKNAIKLTGIIN